MEDLGKTRYLVGKGDHRKLKRNVPAHIRQVAGKTACVERVGRLSSEKVRGRANLFAIQTDGELRRLKAEAQQAGTAALTDDDNPLPNLDETRAQQIGIAYFQSRYEDMLSNRSCFVVRDDPDFAVILADAVEDRRGALAPRPNFGPPVAEVSRLL